MPERIRHKNYDAMLEYVAKQVGVEKSVVAKIMEASWPSTVEYIGRKINEADVVKDVAML